MDSQEIAYNINKVLTKKYPNPKSALEWNTPWQMLVSAVLSAQTNDNAVNKATKPLFGKYPDIKDFYNMSEDLLMDYLKSINYFRNKSKFILYNAKFIIDNFNGVVPSNMEELLQLKGIGRKVANVVIGDVFNNPVGIVVDTHVKRVSYRLGLTKNTDPEKVEKDLVKLFEKKDWVNISHRLIFHGREICIARKPKCEICPLNIYCEYFKTNKI